MYDNSKLYLGGKKNLRLICLIKICKFTHFEWICLAEFTVLWIFKNCTGMEKPQLNLSLRSVWDQNCISERIWKCKIICIDLCVWCICLMYEWIVYYHCILGNEALKICKENIVPLDLIKKLTKFYKIIIHTIQLNTCANMDNYWLNQFQYFYYP